MLSLTRGRDIAIFNKGTNKGKKIFLHGEHDFSNKSISEVIIPQEKKFNLLGRDYFKKKKLSRPQIQTLKRAVDNDLRISQVEEDLQNEYEDIIKIIDNKLKTELDFSDLSNIHLFPIPQKFSERIYIPAPSGSGSNGNKQPSASREVKLGDLDMKNPEHRAIYKEKFMVGRERKFSPSN